MAISKQLRMDIIAKHFKGQAGFSLVELLIGMLITVLLLAGIFTMLGTAITVSKQGSSLIEVQQTARMAVDAIVRDLRYAQAGTVIIGSGSGLDEDNKSISFMTEQYGIVKYYQDEAGILRRESGGGAQPVTGNNSSANNVKIAVAFSWGDSEFPQDERRLINIRLEAYDAALPARSQGRTYTIETSVTIMNTVKTP